MVVGETILLCSLVIFLYVDLRCVLKENVICRYSFLSISISSNIAQSKPLSISISHSVEIFHPTFRINPPVLLTEVCRWQLPCEQCGRIFQLVELLTFNQAEPRYTLSKLYIAAVVVAPRKRPPGAFKTKGTKQITTQWPLATQCFIRCWVIAAKILRDSWVLLLRGKETVYVCVCVCIRWRLGGGRCGR